MKISRRHFLQGGVAAISSLSGIARALGPASRRVRRPRAIIQILLQGGMDAVLTTDPKVRTEVRDNVDIPFQESEITSAGKLRIGPLFAPLAPILSSAAIVNGITCGTVAHSTGVEQMVQMCRLYPYGRIGFTELLGEHLGRGAPLTAVQFAPSQFIYRVTNSSGRALRIDYKDDFEDKSTLLSRLSRLAQDPPRRAMLQSVLDAEVKACSVGATQCISQETVRNVLRAMPQEPLPGLPAIPVVVDGAAPKSSQQEGEAPIDANKLKTAQMYAGVVRDTIFLLKHDLTRSVFIAQGSGWDSHGDNLEAQGTAMAEFAPMLTSLVNQLKATTTRDGTPLDEQVLILISSELGRFPSLNKLRGKDHLPEFPAVLLGPGIKPGQYGATDDQMFSLPISFASGNPSSSKKDRLLVLEDLAVTVLNVCGIEDAGGAGYRGSRMDFLLS